MFVVCAFAMRRASVGTGTYDDPATNYEMGNSTGHPTSTWSGSAPRFRATTTAAAGGPGRSVPPERVLELWDGDRETTRRLIEAYPDAWVVGLDSSPDMVFRARQTYDDVQLARMEDPLPDGPWDLVISVLSVNALTDDQKKSLFRRVREHSRSLVIGDAFEAKELQDVLAWSGGELTWQADDLAVIRAIY